MVNRMAKVISRRKCVRPFLRYAWKNTSRRLDLLQFVPTLSNPHFATHFEARCGWQTCLGPELKFLWSSHASSFPDPSLDRSKPGSIFLRACTHTPCPESGFQPCSRRTCAKIGW